MDHDPIAYYMSLHWWIDHAPALMAAVVGLVGVMKVNKLHILINSRIDQLLALSKESGRAEEKAEAQARKDRDVQYK